MRNFETCWLQRAATAGICALAIASACGPTGNGSPASGADAGNEADSGFTPERRYPGYCRGLVHRDLDEVPDAVEYSTYDGDLLKRRSYDADRDGTADQRTTFAYDDRSRLVERDIDRDTDGDLDELRFYDYDGDRLVRESVDEDGDRSIDLVISYRYDDSGRRVHGEGRSTESGEVELVLDYKWTEGGELDLLTMDGTRGAPDEDPDRLLDFLYDAHGNLVEGRFDYDANGRADIIVFYTYECWRGEKS